MTVSVALLRRLQKLVRHRGRSQEDAEDLIQDALVRLTEYCRTAQVLNEEAFLERTIVNLSIDRHRRACRRPQAAESVEEIAETLPLLDTSPGPDEVLAAQQRLNEIKEALDAISVRTREIYLAHRAGYSHQDLAAAFGVSTSTVEKAIARAVVALMDMREPQ
jgi:RNA polymerase sigma factor (sigma-70 family)